MLTSVQNSGTDRSLHNGLWLKQFAAVDRIQGVGGEGVRKPWQVTIASFG